MTMQAVRLNKLAELRARTDRDLLRLLQLEVGRLGTGGHTAERDRRLREIRSMLSLVEHSGGAVGLLELEIEALLAEPRVFRLAC